MVRHRAGAATDERFNRIYDAYYARVLAYCLRRTGRADAADAAADTFAVVWRRLPEVPAEPNTLPWLYGVAYRVLAHQWRSAGRQHRLLQRARSTDQAQMGPETRLVLRHDYELVLRASRRLKPADREILRLVLWEELSHGEAAVALGVTAVAARQRLHRAKRRLAREFRRLGGFDEGGST